MTDETAFGVRLRQLRIAAGLSLGTLGDRIYFSKAQISRVENGQSPPTTAFAAKCDQVFGTSGELVQLVSDLRKQVDPRFDLPAGPALLFGRQAQVQQLETYFRTSGGPRTRPVKVAVLYGLAGVGKTALAIETAHRLRDDYPDGCLYLDLRGYHPTNSPLTAVTAMDRILRRFGVAGRHLPREPEELAALYREQLSGRSLLFLLDSVRSPDQVLELLPQQPNSSAIVTSRGSLAALDDAFHLPLYGLAVEDAVDLFRSVADVTPSAEDPDDPTHSREIVELCGRLPLAVRIVGARFRNSPTKTLNDAIRLLSDRSSRMNELDDGHRSVAAAFRSSYAALPNEQQRALSLIALHPGTRINVDAAAALTQTSSVLAEQVLDQLVLAGMLERKPAGAFHLHNLLHHYLRTEHGETLSGEQVAAALGRLFDYYLRTAAAADSVIGKNRYYRVPLPFDNDDAGDPRFPTYDAAMRWTVAELENLVPLSREMLETGRHATCWQFAYCLRGYFFVSKEWATWTATYNFGLMAAQRAADRRAEGVMRINLGLAADQLGDRFSAAQYYTEAKQAFAEAADPAGEANTIHNLAWLELSQGNYRNALELAEKACAFYSSDGDRAANAMAIAKDCVGRSELKLGIFDRAANHLQDVLEAFIELDFTPVDISQVYANLGRATLELGRRDLAVLHYSSAISYAQQGNGSYDEALAWEGLGATAAAMGHDDEAAKYRSSAQALFQAIGAPDAERLAAYRLVPARTGTEPIDRDNRILPATRLRILAINDEWLSHKGGLSTFNRKLCAALAAAGAEVFCLVPSATPEAIRDAQSVGVQLLSPASGAHAPDALTKRPALPGDRAPDVVVGHGRVSGPHAHQFVEDHYPRARLFHFAHVNPDQIEFEKPRGDLDPTVLAEERTALELSLARSAHCAVAVGPKLYNWLSLYLSSGDTQHRLLRLDPGFDAHDNGDRGYRPNQLAQVLIAGRLAPTESSIKGLDIAARALGFALTQLLDAEDREVELVVRGVPEHEGPSVRQRVREWAGIPGLRVLPRVYSTAADALQADLRRAVLLLMPSRVEGFGLVALEAIVAGTPVLVSKSSGLGMLLGEVLPRPLASQVTVPVTDDPDRDRDRWGHAIATVLDHPDAAFATAREIQKTMAKHRTWSMAANALLTAGLA